MNRRLLLLYAGIWLALAATPAALDAWRVGELAIFIIYGIFAMSLALIWGQIGLLCFGQAVFFGIGAYAMAIVTRGMVPSLETATSSWLGLLAAVLLPALFANLIGRFLFYGRGLQGAYFGIVTLAIAIIAERLAIQWDWIGGFNGLTGIPPLELLPGVAVVDSLALYYTALGFAFVVFLLLERLVRSPRGTLLRAIRDDEERTRFFGYDTASYKLAAFSISGGVAGLAGALFVSQFSFASPALIGFQLSTEVLIWVALGGKTMLIAAFLGAIVVRIVGSFLADTLLVYWPLVLGGLFVATVVAFPRGLIGEVIAAIEGGALPGRSVRRLRLSRRRAEP